MSAEKISIIIPTHNEENSVADVVKNVAMVMDNSRFEYEMIVVDDGSTDDTLEKLKREDAGVRVIEHGYNRGYGAAIKTGIKNAHYDLILTVDADGSHPVEEIPRILEKIEGFDTVVGARTGKGAVIPLIRRPAKWVLRKLAEYLSESRIPDLNSGFRLIRKSVVERFIKLLPNSFSFSSTITIAMHVNDYRVRYVPVTCHKRAGGKSKIRPIYDTLNFLQLILRTILYFAPLKIFIPLSVLLFLGGIGVFLYSYLVVGEIMDITTILLLVASIQVFSIGLLADLMDKRT